MTLRTMYKYLFLFILSATSLVVSEKFRFDNYSVFRIVPRTEDDINLLRHLMENDLDFDFWNEPVKTSAQHFVNVMAKPIKKQYLEDTLNFYNIEYNITISNVQEAIEKEKVAHYSRNTRSMTFDAYYELDDIEAWMTDMIAAYPEASDITGGVSYEGRPLKGIKISHGSGRKVIFVESGIHAREWISPSFACYVINELLTSSDPYTVAAANDYDWYIFPVVNPDGYVWTHTNFRMWRKNRRPVGNNFGIDLNRNWDSNWLVVGASTNPASDTYAGSGPFSEPETSTLSNYIRTIEDIQLYLSVHSFGQYLLVPFGNTSEPLANYHDAVNVGRRAMGATSVRYGTLYSTGNIVEVLYYATGGSDEWVKEALDVPLVYCYELRDNGRFGFLLPPDQILPNNLEAMDGVLEIIYQGRRFGVISGCNVFGASILMIPLILLRLVVMLELN